MMPSNSHSVKQKIRAGLARFLKNSHDHFSLQLPAHTGWVSTWLRRRFFSGVVIKPDQLEVVRQLPKDALLVYATKYKSKFDFLFYHTRYGQLRLPTPEIGLDYTVWFWQPLMRIARILLAGLDHLIGHHKLRDPYRSGHIRKELEAGKAAFVSLVEDKGFYRRFVKSKGDPIQYLLDIQKDIQRPIYIVPHLMFFGKRPLPSIPGLIDLIFGSEHRPGRLRRLVTLFRSPGKVFVEISEPLNLKRFIEHPDCLGRSLEYQSLRLRRQMLHQFNRHRQTITGPILKTSEELKESILSGDRLRAFMEQYAQNRKEPIYKVRKEAAGYLDEIAAAYKPLMIRILDIVVGWLTHTMFDGAVVDEKGLAKLKVMSQRGPLVLVPCHKSHIDYLILSYILYHNNMPCPQIAAGKNLSFWPMGPIFRASGAFFIRRTFRGAVLYSRVFGEYVYKLLEEGYNVEQFIEGGRSRTGKLLMPKLGLLSILINAYKNGACEDMIIAPVYIGYDRVIEEQAYLHEMEGGKKEPENLKQVVRARKFLKKRYGKIYINFSPPISMNDLLESFPAPLADMPSKDQNALIRNLGWRVINAIDRVTVVTPHSLVSAAVLNAPGQRFTLADILASVEVYLHALVSQKAHLSDTLSYDQAHAIRHAFDTFIQRKFIERVSEDKYAPLEEAVFATVENKRTLLEYYKNNSIGYFVPSILVAMAILERDAFQFTGNDLHAHYAFSKDFFKYEFAFNIDRSNEYFVRKVIKTFIDDAILMPHQTLPDTYNLTSAGYRKIKLFADYLKPYFEAYWVVLNFFKRYPRNAMDSKERLKKIQAMGNRMYKRKEIERPEALGKLNFKNGIDYFTTHKVKGSEDEAQLAHYETLIQRHLQLLQK
jgi:glycerol-3-phosphate O-acyltransferase